jgi:hypothetical protein
MTKHLAPLDAFNRRRAELWAAGDFGRDKAPNGIACPVCGAELVDEHPDQILTSCPPQKAVRCLGCGFAGCRIA